MKTDLENALKELAAGKKPIVLFDSSRREKEADLVLPAGAITPEHIRFMRENAGGLICLAIDSRSAQALDLPFLADVFVESTRATLNKIACSKTPYGDKPAFSVSINHKQTFTGITDNDRALTIKKFAALVANGCSKKEFIENFYSPGHVHLLISRGIKKRRGHTELAIELMKKAKLAPAVVLCELLGNGTALSRDSAKKFAEKNGFEFLEGDEIC